VRDALSLAAAKPDTKRFVVMTASRLGKARLIDNIQWP
jgi:pantothenate synthetase